MDRSHKGRRLGAFLTTLLITLAALVHTGAAGSGPALLTEEPPLEDGTAAPPPVEKEDLASDPAVAGDPTAAGGAGLQSHDVVRLANNWVDARVRLRNTYYTGRYNLGVFNPASNRWYNISYGWPSAPWSSYTTIRMDGTNYIVGSGGTWLEYPNNLDPTTNRASWRRGDLLVRQTLRLVQNPATGLPDAVQVRYSVTNLGQTSHTVGLRVMIDTMLNGNDAAPFRVPGPGGLETVNYERIYMGSEVPDFWQAYQNLSNPIISAQGTLRGADTTPPDRFGISNWGRVWRNPWNWTPTGNRTGDSAVVMYWNEEPLAAGESRTIVTYYGRANPTGAGLVLSAPAELPYRNGDWQPNPFTAVAYFSNFTGATLQNVRLMLELPPELNTPAPVFPVGDLPHGQVGQARWYVSITDPGTHPIAVEAWYTDAAGNDQLAERTTAQVVAHPPPLPPDVTVEGFAGHTAAGTLTAWRCGTLTIRSRYDDPQPDSVTFRAEDPTGKVVELAMRPVGGGWWTARWRPCDTGWWGSPVQIRITPHYGTDPGPVRQFPIVLIDPSGRVYNVAHPWIFLPDATATLEYLDPVLGSWVVMDPTLYPGMLQPETNPQTTGSDGHYGWDAAAGSYRVRVNRAGFAATLSPAVTIPPPVTDLDIGLTPTDTTPPTVAITPTPGNYSTDIEVTLSGSDDLAGMFQIEYQVDGGAWVTVDGDQATLTLGAGTHTVAYRARDYAGNLSAVLTATYTVGQADTTGPVISSPLQGRQLITGEPVALTWSVSDPESGVASESATLNGAPVQQGDPATGNAGRKYLRVTATNGAGLSSSRTFVYTVYHQIADALGQSPAGGPLHAEWSARDHGGSWVRDTSVRAILYRNGSRVTSFRHGTGSRDIQIDDAAQRYTLHLNPADYGLSPGDQVRIDIYFANLRHGSIQFVQQ